GTQLCYHISMGFPRTAAFVGDSATSIPFGDRSMATTVPIGLFAPCATPSGTRRYVETLGRGAEERGFESLWVPEHVAGFDRPGRALLGGDRGTLDPFVLLSFLAAGTSTLRLGTGVTLI